MAKIILIGATSELGNATANKFLESSPDIYTHLLRIGREIESSDLTWKNCGNLTETVESTISAASIRKGDLIILALGSLCEGITAKNVDALNVTNIGKSMEATGLMSCIAFLSCIKALAVEGGGGVIVFSSVASNPVLTANLFYGASKKYLEIIVMGVRSYTRLANVKVSLVRPGFVATKMNSRRKATSFSSSCEKVANRIFSKFPNRTINIPPIFILISFLLERSRFLRSIANKKIEKSNL